MSALEKPFLDAIAAKEIEGAVLEGRSTTTASYSQAFGNRTLLDTSEQPSSTSDILALASATKLLTTIAALQCCEKGLLSLDANLATNELSGLAGKGVLQGGDNHGTECPSTEPLRRPVTLRHLLNHSSGLVYDFFNSELKRWRAANVVSGTATGVPDRLTHPLAFQPGEEWMYGPGIDWAGYLVEQAVDMKLDQYLRKYVLAPLGVESTEISFFPIAEGLGGRMPDLNPKDPGGHGLSAGAGRPVLAESDRTCYGGHGAYGTSGAYIAILESLLKNDENLLSKDSVKAMFNPQLELTAKVSLETACSKDLVGPAFSQNTNGPNRDHGLGGLLVGSDGDGGMGAGTLAWGGGINTAWFVDRKNGICGFVSPQMGLPPSWTKAMELKVAFREGLKGQLLGASE